MENQEAFNQIITEDKLFSGLTDTGKYSNLCIRFRNDTQSHSEFGHEEFLLVSRLGYRKVIINKLDFHDNKIYMEIGDCWTGRIEQIALDIEDDSFRFLLISWHDIKKLVADYNIANTYQDEMLDFDF